MENLLLSIITVSRNDYQRLKKTTDSLSNYYGDLRFEHIIIDGNSNDITDYVVSPLLTENNFIFIKDNDFGIYDAMNRGVLRAGAQFLLFLNCGDTILATPDEFASILKEVLVNSEISDMHIACFPIQQQGIKYYKTIVPSRIAKSKMPVSHQGMIFSKAFLNVNKYKTCYKIASDYDVYLRASKIIFIDTVSIPLVRTEIEGVASSNPLKSYKEYIVIAYNSFSGISRIIILFRILSRFIFVILLKVLFPKSWVAFLRGV